MKYIAEVDGLEFPIEILDEHHICFGGETIEVDLAAVSGQLLYSLIVNGESFEGYVYPDERSWQVLLLGRSYSIFIEDEREKRLRTTEAGIVSPGREYTLKAPMPGLAVAVPIDEGQRVEKGQILVILESMKMQNELRAPFEGNVARLKIKAGEGVQQKQALLTIVAPITSPSVEQK
ncbi:MAG: biotin/lipoyl-containing protein [Anaerolineales bacterium]|jgi:acetyl/propionyl-CoA carboxylase alpha subunit